MTAPVTLMTFNVYNDSSSPPGEGSVPAWMLRRELVVETIRAHAPDVVGLQEVYPWQVDYLAAELPRYACIGRGRDARGVDEAVPIMYRRERLELLDCGHFWLSESPHTPGSRGGKAWGEMETPRMVTWVRLRHKGRGGSFYVYNTHLASDEDGGEASRMMSARLIAERIATRAAPTDYFFLLGDFNAPEEQFPTRYLTGRTTCSGPGAPRPPQRAPVRMVDVWRVLHSESGGTRCSSDPAAAEGQRFDYILAWDPGPQVAIDNGAARTIAAPRVAGATVVRPRGSCASDHCAVVATVEIPLAGMSAGHTATERAVEAAD